MIRLILRLIFMVIAIWFVFGDIIRAARNQDIPGVGLMLDGLACAAFYATFIL